MCFFLNKKKTYRLNRIRIASARVRGSNKDGFLKKICDLFEFY